MSFRRTLVRTLLVGLIATVVATLVVAISGASASRAKKTALAQSPITQSQLAFHDQMRKLWEDHVTWTRNVIISFDAHLRDRDAVVARLLQNQTDIGEAIEPYYGDAAAKKLTALLREHILGAAKVLVALNADDRPALTVALNAWYVNAHEIAEFLNSANPQNWPLAEMDQMMKDHLATTTREAVARHQDDWNADVAAYDAVHLVALKMADMLSDGIIAQFPRKFVH